MSTEKSYYQAFCEEYGITKENNTIKLYREFAHNGISKAFDFEIFTEDDKGNLDILIYTLDRQTILYNHKNATPDRPNINNNRDQLLKLKRYAEPKEVTDKDGNTSFMKYQIVKGIGTYPFIPKPLIEKFEKKEPIETLILTEGYKKAWYASNFGFDIIGLSSITHYKDKETQMLYKDVHRIISELKPKNLIILYDGDCLNISGKALDQKKDLFTRPYGFFNSAVKIRELLKDYKELDIYFSHVNSFIHGDNPKGLDDILLTYKEHETDLLNDLLSFSRPGYYFTKKNITNSVKELEKYFHFKSHDDFYNFHAEQIGEKEFIFRGNNLKYSEKEKKIQIMIPKEVFNYFRVGDDFYKHIKVPNKYGQLEKQYHRRNKETVKMEIGGTNVDKVPAHEAFCNVPAHVNYSRLIHNCFNMYSEFEHTPEDGDITNTLKFIDHIFGEQKELGLDYVQLLYQQPTQILPIVCLVSKENNTGKSTFVKWLKAIFTSNCTVIGNEQLNSNFNASWASKLIVACEESFIDKQATIEKIKALSTGDKISLEMKGKDAGEIDFFGKFILCSNKEKNFIIATKHDIRYWVRKVPTIAKENMNVKLLECLIEEIPAFLYFLNQRTMHTECKSRMWFDPEQIKTKMLDELISFNRPRVEREIYEMVKELFIETGDNIIYMTLEEIITKLSRKEPTSNVRYILEENLKVDRYKNKNGKYDSCNYFEIVPDVDNGYKKLKKRGRPYLFHRENFITERDFEQYQITQNNDHENSDYTQF